MDKLNKYQKIQIILLALIIIAFITFIMSIVKNKTLKNYTSEQTFSESTDIVEETENDGMLVDEEGMEIQDEDTSWDDEDAEDTKVDPENEESKDYYLPYYIKINYTANCITVYKKDNSGTLYQLKQ